MSLILGEPPKERIHVPRNFAWEKEFLGVSNSDYHKWPELSSSRLKKRLKSPAHFACEDEESNDAFDLGTCAHSLNLEGDSSIFIEVPDFKPKETTVEGAKPGTTKKHTITAKSQLEEFMQANQGKILLTGNTYYHVMKMHEVWLKNREVQSLMKGAKVESSYKYLDEQTGIPCRFRTDALRDFEDLIVDYKTSESARQFEFEKAIVRYGYHVSAAHYLVGAQRVIKSTMRRFTFIVQEKKPPYALAIIPMSRRDIERSIELREKLMLAIKADQISGEFLDYTREIKETSLPGYAYEFAG